MFLDESGDHSLSKIDNNYSVFVLAGVILDKNYADEVLSKEFDNFKLKFFGRKDIILHTADITRNKKGFEKLSNSHFREEFYEELNILIEKLEFKVVACVIKKDKHLLKYGFTAAIDPDFLSLDILVERFCMELKTQPDSGLIIAERRGYKLDEALELAWLNLKNLGTNYMPAKKSL